MNNSFVFLCVNTSSSCSGSPQNDSLVDILIINVPDSYYCNFNCILVILIKCHKTTEFFLYKLLQSVFHLIYFKIILSVNRDNYNYVIIWMKIRMNMIKSDWKAFWCVLFLVYEPQKWNKPIETKPFIIQQTKLHNYIPFIIVTILQQIRLKLRKTHTLLPFLVSIMNYILTSFCSSLRLPIIGLSLSRGIYAISYKPQLLTNDNGKIRQAVFVWSNNFLPTNFCLHKINWSLPPSLVSYCEQLEGCHTHAKAFKREKNIQFRWNF